MAKRKEGLGSSFFVQWCRSYQGWKKAKAASATGTGAGAGAAAKSA